MDNHQEEINHAGAQSRAEGANLTDVLERPRYERRLGRFALSRMTVERDQETARAIMGRCIIVRCEMMYHMNAFEYIAMSPFFDEVTEGMMAPEYEVHISEGGARIEFKRSNAIGEGPGAASCARSLSTDGLGGKR